MKFTKIPAKEPMQSLDWCEWSGDQHLPISQSIRRMVIGGGRAAQVDGYREICGTRP